MAFDTLPEQNYDSFTPRGRDYMQQTIARSRAALAHVHGLFDIAYGSDPRQQLDVYRPLDAGDAPLPVVIFLHGGGWAFGFKEQMAFMAPIVTALPAIFVSVSYRLIPQHRFPAALEDTVAALKWVHDNIAAHGGDPTRIAIGGHSAGGHLAALAVLRRELLKQAGVPEDVVKLCTPVSATFEFQVGELEAMGKAMLDQPEDAPQASPINFVEGNGTPFFITWGSTDFPRIMTTSRLMVETMVSLGQPVSHREHEGCDHYDTNLDLADPHNPWVGALRQAFAPTAAQANPEN